MKEKLLNGLNLILMADFWFVLLSFAWFAIAVLGRSTHLSLGLDLWYSLWQPLFQPAIGLLMAGALISGLVSWLSKQWTARQSD